MGIDPGTLGLSPADGPDADPALDDAATGPVPASPWTVGGPAPMLPVPWPEQGTSTAPLPWAHPGPARAADISLFRPPTPGRGTPPVPGEPDGDAAPAQPTTPAPNGVRQTVAAFGAGLVTAGSARRIQLEQDLVAAVRTPQREHHVVVCISGKGGVGATTTAAGVALTVATLRDDRTALLDAQAGTDSLRRRLAGDVTATQPGTPERPDGQAVSPLRLSSGLHVVDGAPWQAPAAPADLFTRIGDLLRDHTFTFVDLGDDVGAAARQALAASTRVLVVTAADRHAARATRVTLDRIHQVQPARLGDAVIAVVCRERWQYRRVLREVRTDLGSQATPIVPIPHEPALAAMDHLDLSRLRAASRAAYLRVAAALAGSRSSVASTEPDVTAAPWPTCPAAGRRHPAARPR
ncbi:MAG TPA: hypothetical protein VK891_00415, partial [Euzebyales bacterium]|nr:hypothetical protein [Euzebyales bacterium]